MKKKGETLKSWGNNLYNHYNIYNFSPGMLPILKKEITTYLSSLVAYVTISVFLLVLGLFLWVFPDTSILAYGYAGLDSLFSTAPYLFMFLVPAVTMRSLAEERREGTFELLLTDEAKRPIAVNEVPNKNSPMYEPITAPVSIFPAGAPRLYTLK